MWNGAVGVAVVLLLAQLDVATSLGLVGYQEGARHVVTCDGYIKGFEWHFTSDNAGYKDQHLQGIRVLCSTARMGVEFWGERGDENVFGTAATADQIIKTECAQGSGVVSITWRKAGQASEGAIKVAGIKVLCGSETSTDALVADRAKTPQEYPLRSACSQTPNPPAGPSVRAKSVVLWFNDGWCGMELASCEVPAV